jgi:hypothetical protein
MSSHKGRFADWLRRRYAGWNVGITRAPSRSRNLPRSAEIGSVVPSRKCADGLPSATMTRG